MKILGVLGLLALFSVPFLMDSRTPGPDGGATSQRSQMNLAAGN